MDFNLNSWEDRRILICLRLANYGKSSSRPIKVIRIWRRGYHSELRVPFFLSLFCSSDSIIRVLRIASKKDIEKENDIPPKVFSFTQLTLTHFSYSREHQIRIPLRLGYRATSLSHQLKNESLCYPSCIDSGSSALVGLSSLPVPQLDS